MGRIICSVDSCVNCDAVNNECLLNVVTIKSNLDKSFNKEDTMCNSFFEK